VTGASQTRCCTLAETEGSAASGPTALLPAMLVRDDGSRTPEAGGAERFIPTDMSAADPRRSPAASARASRRRARCGSPTYSVRALGHSGGEGTEGNGPPTRGRKARRTLLRPAPLGVFLPHQAPRGGSSRPKGIRRRVAAVLRRHSETRQMENEGSAPTTPFPGGHPGSTPRKADLTRGVSEGVDLARGARLRQRVGWPEQNFFD